MGEGQNSVIFVLPCIKWNVLGNKKFLDMIVGWYQGSYVVKHGSNLKDATMITFCLSCQSLIVCAHVYKRAGWS